MAKIQHVNHIIGDDKTIRVTLDPVPSGGITGWAITAIIKTSDTAASAEVTKTVGSGITITDGALAKFTIVVSDTDSDGLTGVNRWKAKRTDASTETTLVYGDYKMTSVPTDV